MSARLSTGLPREAEVQNLDRAVGPDLDVRGLEVPMNDALLVRRFECIGDRCHEPQDLGHCHRSAVQPLGQRLSVDELENQAAHLVELLEPVDGSDVRVVECGQHAGLALEPGEAASILDERVREDLDRDIASQLGIAGAMTSPMPPAPMRSCSRYGPSCRPAKVGSSGFPAPLAAAAPAAQMRRRAVLQRRARPSRPGTRRLPRLPRRAARLSRRMHACSRCSTWLSATGWCR
jgi:hypothetical protein